MASTETILATQQAYAATAVEDASAMLEQMQLALNNVGYDFISFNGSNLPAAPELPDLLVAPTFDPVDLTIPPEPGAAPAFQAISSIDLGAIPQFTTVAPTLTVPTLPSQLGDFNITAPTITTNFTFPDSPGSLDLEILAPTLIEHDAPERPTIALPSFDSISPTGPGDAPTDLATKYVAAYRDQAPGMVASLEASMNAALLRFNPNYDTQVTAINTKLTSFLAGGTALAPAIETAIYERAKDKELGEARRTSRAAYADAASRGFTMPDGIAFSEARKARQAASDNLARAGRDIAIAQAEREQQNLQWAVGQVASLTNAALSASINYHGNLVSLNGQALQASRDIVGMVVESYNASLRVFEARLGGYKVEADVYGTRLKVAMAPLELYAEDIKALQALTNVDESKVSMYRSKIAAQESIAGVYKTRVEAVVAEASLEKLKLDLFKTQAEGFAVQAQIKEFEYKAFTALMSGNEQMVKVYSTQLDAHNLRLKGIEIKANVQTEVVRAQVMSNDGIAKQYLAQLDSFKTIVDARAKVASTEMDSRRQYMDAWVAQSRTAIANADLAVTVYRAKSEIVLQNGKLELEALYKGAESKQQYAKSLAEVAIAGAKVHEGFAASIMSGQNTLVAQTLAE